MRDWSKWLAIVISIIALVTSIYAAFWGPRHNTLHAERIKLSSKVLQSSAAYGWQLGSYRDIPDRAPFSNGELHDPDGSVDEIVKLHNTLEADLASMDIILPDDWQEKIKACRDTLRDMHTSFAAGKFSELQPKFAAYYRAFENLKKDLRIYLR